MFSDLKKKNQNNLPGMKLLKLVDTFYWEQMWIIAELFRRKQTLYKTEHFVIKLQNTNCDRALKKSNQKEINRSETKPNETDPNQSNLKYLTCEHST